jgi:hypothetical protein
MKIIRTDSSISDKDRADILFSGDLLIQRDISAMHQLIEWTSTLLNDALKPLGAVTAQANLTPEKFIKLTTDAQTNFRVSEQARSLFFKALEECGVDLKESYYDHFPLRIVPYGTEYGGARNSFISPHRDTWGSNIHSQINWWAPIYELEESRTIAIYPKYWADPIANDTSDWRFDKHIESRRNTPKGLKAPYPSAPSPMETVDESEVVKVMLEPGDVLSFSSAHLHASVPNSSKLTRYSVEMRTINQKDLQAGREAPNVDNEATELMYNWFKRITDKKISQF